MAIYVTKPSLPPINEMKGVIDKIWETGVLTNSGPYHQQLEHELSKYLNVPYVSLVTNCTAGLDLVVKANQLSGNVITTPYSFVATSNVLLLNHLEPRYVDINHSTFNIDPQKIESKIDENTSAIMAVHTYGNPCDVDKLEKLSNKYKLKLIYDAAHAFAVKYKEKSIVAYGDYSVLSFHATKVFNTFEGGAIISKTFEQKKKIDRLRNFGIVDEVSVEQIGYNCKMSELNAAVGLLQLPRVKDVIAARKRIYKKYTEELGKIPDLILPIDINGHEPNYSYYPIRVTSGFPDRNSLYDHLKLHNIYARKYFYPCITNLEAYQKYFGENQFLPNANLAAEQILCLPCYPDLSCEDQDLIISTIKIAFKNGL